MKMRGEFIKPKGLIYVPNFISTEEEQKLLNYIKQLEFEQVIIHDNPAKRTIKFFGEKYLDAGNIGITTPLPEEIIWLRDRCSKEASLDCESVVSCLITQYPKGSTINWHTDYTKYGSKVLGISLNSTCNMQFQRKKDDIRYVYQLDLEPSTL